MSAWLATVSLLLAVNSGPVETRFVQVAPTPTDGAILRTAGQTRAVVLIQVCAPNVGSPLARIRVGVGAVQKPFMQSLTSQSRTHFLADRSDRRIPTDVDFVCVVGNGLLFSDGVVSARSQWPEDLQAQGVPAVALGTEHWLALRNERAAMVIARLVRERQPRWDAAQVAAMRKRLFGEK